MEWTGKEGTVNKYSRWGEEKEEKVRENESDLATATSTRESFYREARE